MNDQMISDIALANGFKLKEQANGEQDLHSYVYEFANALEKQVLENARSLFIKEVLSSEWVLCGDRMPDEGQEVLVHHFGHVVQATKDKKYSGGFKQRNCRGWESVSTYISHWMPKSIPLPEIFNFYYANDEKQLEQSKLNLNGGPSND